MLEWFLATCLIFPSRKRAKAVFVLFCFLMSLWFVVQIDTNINKREICPCWKNRGAISHPVSPFQWWWPSSKPPLKLCIFMDFFFNSQQTKYHNSGLILFRNSPLSPEFYFPTHSTPWTGKGIGLDWVGAFFKGNLSVAILYLINP